MRLSATKQYAEKVKPQTIKGDSFRYRIRYFEVITTYYSAMAENNETKAPQKEEENALPFKYKHARPYVAVDCVLFGIKGDRLHILLKKQSNPDLSGEWVLPGRFIRGGNDPMDEYSGAETATEAFAKALIFEYKINTVIPDGDRIFNDCIDAEYNLLDPDEKGIKIIIDGDNDEHEAYSSHPESDSPQKTVDIIQLPVRSYSMRDGRYRVISIPHMMIMKIPDIPLGLNNYIRWVPVDETEKDIKERSKMFGFDHANIIKTAIPRLQEIARTRPLGRELLPEEFTIKDLGDIYQAIFPGNELDRSNFKKVLEQRKLLISVKTTTSGRRRPLNLYKFDIKVYEQFKRNKDFAFNPRIEKEPNEKEPKKKKAKTTTLA